MIKTISALLLAAALVGGCGKKNDATATDKDKAAEPAAKAADPAAKPADPAAKPADPAAAAVPVAPVGDVTIASDDDYMAKAKVAIGKLLDTFKADGTDCDKLAGDITSITTDSTVKALDAYEKAHPDAKKKFDAAMKDQTKAFEAAATPAITACAKNQKFMDAVSKLGN